MRAGVNVDTSASLKSVSHAHHTHKRICITLTRSHTTYTRFCTALSHDPSTTVWSTVYSLEPLQSVLQIYWHTLELFRIRSLVQHYYATYAQYDVLLYLTWMQYICRLININSSNRNRKAEKQQSKCRKDTQEEAERSTI